jgi:drug/metabolite transporter (DMT)-like permease
MQSSIVLPFLITWLVFNDKINIISIAGMVVILLSLCFIVRGKQLNGQNTPSDSKSKIFLLLAFAAFLGNGISQSCSLLPNKFTMIFPTATALSSEVMAWRVPVTALSGLVVWGIIALVVKMKVSLKQWQNGLTYALIVFIGQTLLYIAIDILSKYKLSGIVYPLAMGCCVIQFSIYCIVVRKERLHCLEKIGLGILTLGLFTQAIAAIF